MTKRFADPIYKFLKSNVVPVSGSLHKVLGIGPATMPHSMYSACWVGFDYGYVYSGP